MAGVAVNVGFYGLWRTLAILGPPPAAVTGVLLILASLTAVIGIAHAAVQTSLQRVIAYSSVENNGLILAGSGWRWSARPSAATCIVAAGLLAATLQVVAHAVAKSLALRESNAAVFAAAVLVDGGIYRHDFVASAVVNGLNAIRPDSAYLCCRSL